MRKWAFQISRFSIYTPNDWLCSFHFQYNKISCRNINFQVFRLKSCCDMKINVAINKEPRVFKTYVVTYFENVAT